MLPDTPPGNLAIELLQDFETDATTSSGHPKSVIVPAGTVCNAKMLPNRDMEAVCTYLPPQQQFKPTHEYDTPETIVYIRPFILPRENEGILWMERKRGGRKRYTAKKGARRRKNAGRRRGTKRK